MMILICPKQATISKKKTDIKTDSKAFQSVSTYVKRPWYSNPEGIQA